MKRKLSLTLKSLFALFVSLALVLSTAGPANAEVGYAPEKCTGSKDVCEYWSTNDESTEGSWRYFACYEKKVSIKIQVKKGSSWKNIKGASAKGKKSDESCDKKYPYAVSVEVFEKSKGTKTYRLVTNQKGFRTSYDNFKIKVTEYEFDSSDSDGGTPIPSTSPSPTYNKATYDFIRQMSSRIRLKNTHKVCTDYYNANKEHGFGLDSIANEYANGKISEALALSKAESRVSEVVNRDYGFWDYMMTYRPVYCF